MTQPTWYVSPTGNDNWAGQRPESNPEGTDGPLRSLAAAQKAVRQCKARLDEPAEIRVFLRGGVHQLDEPWRFHAEDGGFGRTTNRRAKPRPVVWSAYPGETPVISGGRSILGPWKKETVNGRTVYTITPPSELLENGGFTQLWVNGERRERPRLPKKGLYQVERGLHKPKDFQGHGHNKISNACVYKEGQLHADWHNLQDVQLHMLAWWIDRHVKIKSIDPDTRTVHFDRTAKLRMEWAPGDGIDFVVENVFDALTDPGEWYLDRSARKLYYIPMPGEDLDSAEIVAGKLQKLVEIDGGGIAPGGVGNADNVGGGGGFLRFEGLTFSHCEWCLPDDQAGGKQAAVHVPAAIVIRRAEGCVFQNCCIDHINTYGVELREGTVETTFTRCTLTDLGAGGIRIWHGCRRNTVLDCEIGPGGLVFAAATGVLIGRATGNRVEHCHIHDFYYTGVSAGWNWGYAESDGYGNIIEWNHIHHLGKGLLSDMGGIYLLGHAGGTRLRFNHIHDIDCRRYGGWCMYTDEGSTNVLMESNLCYNANRDPFHQHYGRNNTLRNNILAYGGDAVLAYGKPEEHLGLTIERNILLSHEVPILRSASPERWTPGQTQFDRNLYWCETGPATFERGQIAMYASQPFPDGFAAEAKRFKTLGDIPVATRPPEADTDWQAARQWSSFVNATATAEAPEKLAEMRFLRHGDDLFVRARIQRPAKYNPMDSEAVWNREHVEMFLKPFPELSGMLQFGVDSGGETALLWHDCAAPEPFGLEIRVGETDGGWECTVRIPLTALADAVATQPGMAPDWRFIAGFAVPAALGDFASWQAQGHDASGIEADPKFIAPQNGDFRLHDDSPALQLGFIPWPIYDAGVRH